MTAASLAGFTAGPAGAQPAHGDPKHSTSPSHAFLNACSQVSTKRTAQRACDRAALRDFDRVRATEGLAPMSLPTDFARLTAARQLLVLTNIERVDRGLKPFHGLSKRLDRLAAHGAKAETDPSFPSPFPGDFGGGNWAGVGTSTLLADFVWMYDDGVGSPNRACTSNSPAQCWGHRHNIIHAYHAPRRMGAAVAHQRTSMAAEYIGGDRTDHVTSARWSRLSRHLPVGLSSHHLTVHAPGGGAGHRTLTVWASGEAMHVRFHIGSGHPGWSLSRTSCLLHAGQSCVVTVTEQPADSAVHHASLTVTGPNGTAVVALAGSPTG
jgi:hypothetical protein